jgi:hypothetical protein
LQDLHPSSSHPIVIPKFPTINPVNFKVDIVRKAILKLKKDSAPGLSNLRSEHLVDLIGSSTDALGTTFSERLTQYLNLLVNAEFPEFYYDFISQSKLIPIPKANSSTPRPIVLPEVFTKLAGNILQRMVSSDLESIFAPIQLGYGLPFATEIIISSVDQRLKKADTDIAVFDFENAFNNIDRSVALQDCKSFTFAFTLC